MILSAIGLMMIGGACKGWVDYHLSFHLLPKLIFKE